MDIASIVADARDSNSAGVLKSKGRFPMSTAKVTANSLNVRLGPGTGYDKLGVLQSGQVVSVTGQKDGWYAINYSGKTGYISGAYVNYTPGASGGAAGSGQAAKVTCQTLNVRSGAGTTHAILGTLSQGAMVDVLGDDGSWLKISYKGKAAYISKKYTSISSSGSTSSGGTSSGASGGSAAAPKTTTVTCDSLNVRSGGGTQFAKIGTVTRGQTVSYTSESNGWLKINYKDGTGWISKSYTSAGGGSTSSGGGGASSAQASSMGKAAADRAMSLYSQYVSEKWSYSQNKRSSNGHYDCSSFTHRCWASAGVDFKWANSVAQAKRIFDAGGEVKVSQIQPGDLLFYHNNWNSGPRWRNINHVAIATSASNRVDAGGTPVKQKGIGSPVMVGRPTVLA